MSLVQIIDENGSLCPFESELLRWGVEDFDLDYKMIAVMGGQSGGKSTLLNMVFGTSFAVMRPGARQQTTKGLWLAQSPLDPTTLILDVEGTDSMQRGEQHSNFERKTALFSLAMAQVLLVNLFENELGRYAGSNYKLLQTVFEVYLELFVVPEASRTPTIGAGVTHRLPKTCLLFCVRDWTGMMTESELRGQVEGDLERLWENLPRPDSLQSVRYRDFFDVEFMALPHKVLQPDEFEIAVEASLPRFTDPSHPLYLFSREYEKGVPGSGIGHFAEQIWETIVSNKDLNLPTEREMLALYRCHTVTEEALRIFRRKTKALREAVGDRRVTAGTAETLALAYGDAMDYYDCGTAHYDATVAASRRGALQVSVYQEVVVLVSGALDVISGALRSAFESDLSAALPSSVMPPSNHASLLDGSVSIPRFSQIAATVQKSALDMARQTFDSVAPHGIPFPSREAREGAAAVAFSSQDPEGRPKVWGSGFEHRPSPSGSSTPTMYDDDGIPFTPVGHLGDQGTPMTPGGETPLDDLEAIEEVVAKAEETLVGRFYEVMETRRGKLLSAWSNSCAGAMLPAAIRSTPAKLGAIRDVAGYLKKDVASIARLVRDHVTPALDLSEKEMTMVIVDCGRALNAALHHVADAHASSLPEFMLTRFRGVFSNDSSGVPRVWGSGIDIPKLYVSARDSTIDAAARDAIIQGEDIAALASPLRKLASAAAIVSPRVGKGGISDDVLGMLVSGTLPSDILVVDDSRLQRVLATFSDAASAICGEAQHAQASRTSNSKLPPWAIVAFLLLGWNELMAVLSSPLTLILCIILGGAGFLLYKMGHLGTVINGSMTLGKMAMNTAGTKLKEAASAAAEQQKMNSGSSGRTSRNSAPIVSSRSRSRANSASRRSSGSRPPRKND